MKIFEEASQTITELAGLVRWRVIETADSLVEQNASNCWTTKQISLQHRFAPPPWGGTLCNDGRCLSVRLCLSVPFLTVSRERKLTVTGQTGASRSTDLLIARRSHQQTLVNYTDKISIKLQLLKAELDIMGYRPSAFVHLFLPRQNDWWPFGNKSYKMHTAEESWLHKLKKTKPNHTFNRRTVVIKCSLSY